MQMNVFHITVKEKEQQLGINSSYCVGYSGRDQELTLKHIKELAELGVPEPEEIPALYPVRKSSLTQNSKIEVLGDDSTGEAEIVLIFGDSPDEIYVTVGSDHTDRSLETVDINKSKQVCDKPFARKAWLFEDVIDHWDDLELVSHIYVAGEWKSYQKESVKKILHPQDVIDFLTGKNIALSQTIVFSGTVPLLDGFKQAEKFSMELVDPIKQDSIYAEYEIANLV